MNLKLSRTDLIAIVMAVLVPAAAYLGYFRHRVSQLNRLTQDLARLDGQVADQQKTATDLAVARLQVRKFEDRIARFMGSVTAEDEAQKAVSAIVREAREAGVNIDLIRPGEPVEGKQLSYLPISLTASAEFARFYDFLLRIERSKMLMTVNTMSVESKLLAENCAIKVEIRVYFVKPDTGSAKGAAA